jgi:hypothetical protein
MECVHEAVVKEYRRTGKRQPSLAAKFGCTIAITQELEEDRRAGKRQVFTARGMCP